VDLSSEEFKRGFLTEAANIIEQFEQVLLKLEGDFTSPQADLNELFRHAHNLKGSAQLVGYGDFSKLAHRVEDALFALKEGTAKLDGAAISLLLKCLDTFAKMRAELWENLSAAFNNDDLIGELGSLLSGKAPAAPVASPATKADDMEEFFAAASAAVQLEKMATAGVPPADSPLFAEESQPVAPPVAVPSVAPVVAPVAEPVAVAVEVPAAAVPISAPASAPLPPPAAPVSAPPPAHSPSAKEVDFVRVAMPKIEALNNLVGELVILHTVLEQQKFVSDNEALSTKAIAHLGKLSKEIQDISMSFRMMPLKPTFQKMSRIVRDTSQLLNKKVRFVLVGEDTEIDKTLADGIYDPLVHLIRNSIDHGLESPDARLKAGKQEEGVVKLEAFHEGNKICIQVSDDGHGIDEERVLKKAIEKRLIRDGSKLSSADIIQLLFLPGLSTKEVVTDVSGRGVGMDVVKTNIEALGGEIQVQSTRGAGSKFKIMLPLTTAIIDAMVVKSGQAKYVIPLTQVHESLRPKPEQVHHVHGMGNYLHLRGEVIQLCDIARSLGDAQSTEKPEDKIAIIVRTAKTVFAVLVDDILKQQQIVIRKLGRELRYQKGIVGTSILGDGRPSFILDLVEMYSSLQRPPR
jgi:two-component system, chemotaxis family, sensor kinase CheA